MVVVGLMVIVSACRASEVNESQLKLSGVVEATQVNVVAEVGGRVVEIAVDEGDAVQAGQTVIRLDDAALAVQVKQAQAALSAAEANLAQVKSSARKEAVSAAEAAVNQAQAERNGAQLAFADAQDVLNNPQELLAQIDEARTGVKLAEQGVVAAQSNVDQARWWRDFYPEDDKKRETAEKQLAIAERDAAAAQAQLDGAAAQLEALEAMRHNPVTIRAQVNGARSAYSMTLASVAVAEASLAELQAGPAPEEVALAEAQVHQVQAQLKLAQAYASRAVLSAPLTGVVSSKSTRVGETVQPGVTLLTLADLEEVRLVVYVPQTQLPKVQIHMPVNVSVDAYPSETFTGEVMAIARQAQFTSRDTQAAEDRANVVFAVKVRLSNADHRLKPGMTADAVFDLEP
jgi:HlyD family secretion protein